MRMYSESERCLCGLDHGKPIPRDAVEPVVGCADNRGSSWCCHVCGAGSEGAVKVTHRKTCAWKYPGTPAAKLYNAKIEFGARIHLVQDDVVLLRQVTARLSKARPTLAKALRSRGLSKTQISRLLYGE